MRRVGQLVGIDPDEAALDMAPMRRQVRRCRRRRHRRRRSACSSPPRKARKASDRQACISMIRRLDFMRRHARRLADRLARPGAGQAALVLRVAGLVQHAHQRLGDVVLGVEGGDADIGRRAAAERVQALVQPGMRVVEPDAAPTSAGTAPAAPRPGRGRAAGSAAGRRAWIASARGRASLQEGLVGGEDRLDLGRGDAALVALHQRVVGARGRSAPRAPAPSPAAAAPPRSAPGGPGRSRRAALASRQMVSQALLARAMRLDQRGRQGRGAEMPAAHQRRGWARPIRPRPRRRRGRRPPPARSAGHAPGRPASPVARRAPRRRRAASSRWHPSAAWPAPRRGWRCGRSGLSGGHRRRSCRHPWLR